MDQGLTTERLVVGEMGTNCYLCWDNDSGEGVVIDPGDEGDFISEKILDRKIDLKAILLTHGHFDHVLGVLPIKLNFPVPIYLNSRDNFLYEKAGSSAEQWQGNRSDPVPPIDRDLVEGDKIRLGKSGLRVAETPGHTPGSVCLLSEENKICFCGDLWFKNGVGRSDFSYARPRALSESLKRIRRECQGWRICPGHEEEFWG